MTLQGALLKTTNISLFITSSSDPSINSARVDIAGWLYYKQRDVDQPIAPMTV